MPDRRQNPRVVDQPEPCFVAMRIVKNGPIVGARIFRQLGMLGAEINGAPADVERVWHSGDRIDEARYRDLMADPPRDADKPIDWRARPQPF